MSDDRESYIQSLRDLADWLKAHPEVGIPNAGTIFNVFVTDREELARIARMSSWEKQYFDTWYTLRKSFGVIYFDVNIDREKICKRVVKGTKVIPARAEMEVEDVEWVCEDALLEVR
jgi:hypothetical protein